MVIARYKAHRIPRLVVAAFLVLGACLLLNDGVDPIRIWLAFLLGVAALTIGFASERLHLDLAGMRYRVYRLYATEADFRPLHTIAYIGVRDVIYSGGREDSDDSWGDTYAYEVFLMDEDRGKLVVCHRSSAREIRGIARQVAQLSGARVVDRTQEKVMGRG